MSRADDGNAADREEGRSRGAGIFAGGCDEYGLLVPTSTTADTPPNPPKENGDVDDDDEVGYVDDNEG